MPNDKRNLLAKELLEVQRTLGWMDIVIGSVTDAVYVTDADSRLVFVNQFFANLLNTHRVLLLGKQLADVFPTTLINESTDDFILSLAGGLNEDKENVGVYLWQNDSQEYIFKISRKQLATTDQTVYFAQNITKEHELFRLKNTFINLASHQLRTPMTAIMTYAHMLHDGYVGDLDPEQQKLTQNIMDGSERMIKLINDILYITRIQNDEAEIVVQEVSIITVIETIESELQVRIDDKSITLEKDIPANLPPILCTRPILHEIISNILVNAVQYTFPDGKIKITVTKKHKKFIVSVSDTGIGIPADYIPHIFDQFSRADNALEVFNEGTGLGLYLVKLLVARLNGTIECKSTLNVGTTFTLTLPAK